MDDEVYLMGRSRRQITRVCEFFALGELDMAHAAELLGVSEDDFRVLLMDWMMWTAAEHDGVRSGDRA